MEPQQAQGRPSSEPPAPWQQQPDYSSFGTNERESNDLIQVNSEDLSDDYEGDEDFGRDSNIALANDDEEDEDEEPPPPPLPVPKPPLRPPLLSSPSPARSGKGSKKSIKSASPSPSKKGSKSKGISFQNKGKRDSPGSKYNRPSDDEDNGFNENRRGTSRRGKSNNNKPVNINYICAINNKLKQSIPLVLSPSS
jgi:hypothetical protein